MRSKNQCPKGFWDEIFCRHEYGSIREMAMEVHEGDSTLWWRLIETRFGTVDKGWFSREVARSHGVGMWRKISIGKQRFQECIK